MIGPALTNPAVTDRGLPNVYRVIGRDDVQGGVAAQFAARQLGAKSAYVLHDTTTYGQGTAATFQRACERLGVRVLGVVGTTERRNFGAVIAGWALLRPDVIFATACTSPLRGRLPKSSDGASARTPWPSPRGDLRQPRYFVIRADSADPTALGSQPRSADDRGGAAPLTDPAS
jgi:hypothetical protein